MSFTGVDLLSPSLNRRTFGNVMQESCDRPEGGSRHSKKHTFMRRADCRPKSAYTCRLILQGRLTHADPLILDFTQGQQLPSMVLEMCVASVADPDLNHRNLTCSIAS